MMGDYTYIEPTTNAFESLIELYAWKSCDADIDPLGSSLHNSLGQTIMNISGHRDGCNTACPGNQFYPLLENLREDISYHQTVVCSDEDHTIELSAANIAHRQVSLDWNFSGETAERYTLERSTSKDENYALIAELTGGENTFIDPTVLPNQIYYYRITVWTQPGTSITSDAVSILTLPDISRNTFEVFSKPGRSYPAYCFR